MISTVVSHASSLVLFAGGVAWLFAPDVVFSTLGLSVPAAASWVGQLLGAAWLALASLNWLQRRAVLGGTYSRPLVTANLFHFFIGALVLLKAAQQGAAAGWFVAAPFTVLAMVYAALLSRGPFDK